MSRYWLMIPTPFEAAQNALPRLLCDIYASGEQCVTAKIGIVTTDFGDEVSARLYVRDSYNCPIPLLGTNSYAAGRV